MREKIIMPKMGESIVEGTIIKWLKNEGDIVKKDENLLLISTDKVEAEIAAPINGILEKIECLAGETQQVGTTLGYISDKKDNTHSLEIDNSNKTSKIIVDTSKNTNISNIKQDNQLFLSPLVKRIMINHNISIKEVKEITGSGINNRVTKKDIINYIEELKIKDTNHIQKEIFKKINSTSLNNNILEISNMRKIIMKNMIFSKTNSAHVTTFFEIDYTNIDRYRNKNKKLLLKNENITLTYTSFIVTAVCQALKKHPYINAEIKDDKIILKKDINIGIAVAIKIPEPGLLVPVIQNADKLNINGIAEKIQTLSYKSLNKKIKPEDLSGGTFTVTNPGNLGAIIGTPIINQPQVSILGVGGIKKEVKVIEINGADAIAIRKTGWLSLSFDHRIIDGIVADSFMQELKKILENWKI